MNEESIASDLQRADARQSAMVTMRSAGKANISDMSALLDHADSDGMLRNSGAGDSQTMHNTWVSTWLGEQLVVTAFRRTHVFRRAGGDARRVQLWNHRETASWRHPMA